MKSYSGFRGNALFLVMIAVVLFAALTFAVTRGGGSGTGMTKEKASVAASEVLSYAKTVEQTIQRMMTVYGVGEQSIDPGHSETTYAGVTNTDYAGNSNCTATNCRLFTDKSGPVVVNRFANYVGTRPVTWLDTANVLPQLNLWMVDVNGVGTSAPDIALRITGLSEAVCKAINRQAGFSDSVDPEEVGGSGADRIYTPSNMNTATTLQIGYTNTAFKGATSFCTHIGNATDPNFTSFFHIVVAR